jgi:cyclopropane fatty-acyl-phospholipid synthase-like methyltransferase
VRSLDPYSFFAVVGKRVIHPGGRRSTEELFRLAGFQAGQRVLDVGCGVGTTAIAVARRFGADVTAMDIAPLMLERARANVRRAQIGAQVQVEAGDILHLPYADGSFDRVIAEAVTMFVDRSRAAAELIRVCRPGGMVLATEFLWRRPPTPEAKEIFLGQVCPGMQFDTLDDWVRIYEAAGLSAIQVGSGPFEMMTPKGFLQDEGMLGVLRFMARTVSRPAYMRKMAWLVPRVARAVPYLGYILVAGVKRAG